VVELVAMPHITSVAKLAVVQLGSLAGLVALPTVMANVIDDDV
jgi:hypothetical protein